MLHPQQVTWSNGVSAWKGICPDCGKPMNRIIRRDYTAT